MGNKVSCLKGRNDKSSAITLAIIGPDDAGKTTLSSILAGEPLDPEVSPTVGFRNVKFTIKKFDVTLYDLGGGKNIRPIWKNYFNEVYGVIYMVDSSSKARLREARDLLRDTLEHPQVSGKPLLVLANKADVEGHMEEVDIVNQLDLDRTVNAHNCPSHFLMVSALQSTKAKMKKVVLGGFMWLLESIGSSMDTLEPRVREDMAAVKEMRDKEREERRERVRRQREERENEEDRERRRLGIPKDQESDEEIKGDPFKPLDYNKLKMKEEKLKAEKKKKQQLGAGKLGARDISDLQRIKDGANARYSMDDTMIGRSGGMLRFGKSADLESLDISQSSALMLQGRGTRPTALPPLEPIGANSMNSRYNTDDKKKGKKKKELLALENGEGSMSNGGDDYYRRSDFSLRSSEPYGLARHYDNDKDSMKVDRDDVLRRSDFSYSRSKFSADYDNEREGLRSDTLGRLDLHGSRSRGSAEADVHDLTPRVAKPKNARVVKAGRIDEDENEEPANPYRNMRTSLKEYGDPRMSQKLDEYRDKYPLRSSTDTKAYRSGESKYDSDTKDAKRWNKNMDREDSMYRKSLKNISPPDLHRFDEYDKEDYKDEGIEDDSDNGSEDLGRYSRSLGKYGRKDPSTKQNKWKDENANRRRTQYSDEDEDEEEEEYGSRNKLKDTLKFSRYDNGDSRKQYGNDDSRRKHDDDDSRRKYDKEINNLKYRRDNDYESSYNSRSRFNDSDDDRRQTRTPDNLDQRRKKKKNILKSNKLAPSDDDDGDLPLSQRYTSPRLVQERSSRNTSDTSSKGRNSRTTYFHSGSVDSDLGQKWGLAEDLPTIDNDSRVRRNVRPNFEDSDEDVVY